MYLEALNFASAIRNQAEALGESAYDAVMDKSYIKHPQEEYNKGSVLAQSALASLDFSATCHELKNAITAAAVTVDYRTLGPKYRWWKAVIQPGNPPYQRPWHPGDYREGDTDFTWYPGGYPG